jgi:hypothetical protein
MRRPSLSHSPSSAKVKPAEVADKEEKELHSGSEEGEIEED